MTWQKQKGTHTGNITWSFSLRSQRGLANELLRIEQRNNYHPFISSRSLQRCYIGG